MKRSEKKELMSSYARHKTDTGSPEVQIAIITTRIESLKKHLELHKKDNHSRRWIMLMVAKRRKLLNYLKKKDSEKYEEILSRLDLRK